jgi:hypothetical protein
MLLATVKDMITRNMGKLITTRGITLRMMETKLIMTTKNTIMKNGDEMKGTRVSVIC